MMDGLVAPESLDSRTAGRAGRNSCSGYFWLCGALALLFVLLLAVTWRQDTEVDIKSGRIRTSSVIPGIELQTSISETWLSKNVPSPIGSPEWRMVRRYRWHAHSPHYIFHGAEAQITQLEFLCEHVLHLTADGKQFLADGLLRQWQSGNDQTGAVYISFLSDHFQAHSADNSKQHSAATLKDIIERQHGRPGEVQN